MRKDKFNDMMSDEYSKDLTGCLAHMAIVAAIAIAAALIIIFA